MHGCGVEVRGGKLLFDLCLWGELWWVREFQDLCITYDGVVVGCDGTGCTSMNDELELGIWVIVSSISILGAGVIVWVSIVLI